jgi:hypothetical protein
VSDFVIEEVIGQEGFSTANGEFTAYTVKFSGDQGRGEAQHNRKASSPAPVPGETVDGEIVHQNGRAMLKRIYKPPGGQSGGFKGGGRTEDPKKSAEIRRMASQKAGVALFNTEVALALAGNAPNFLAALGEPGGVSKQLLKRVQWFEDDAKAAGERA